MKQKLACNLQAECSLFNIPHDDPDRSRPRQIGIYVLLLLWTTESRYICTIRTRLGMYIGLYNKECRNRYIGLYN
jgi:hypothetical protein